MPTFGSYGLGNVTRKNINYFGGTINGFMQRNFTWADLEPSQSVFDTASLDRVIDRCISSSVSMSLTIFVGPDSPDWIYDDAGVPVVVVSGSSPSGSLPQPDEYPYYLDSTYQDLTANLWTNIADYIAGWSSERQDALAFWQVCEGSRGDDVPYHGTPIDETYLISDDDWATEKRRIWTLFDSINTTTKTMINVGNDYRNYDWVISNLPDAWIEDPNLGSKFNFPGELYALSLPTPPRTRVELEGINRLNNQIYGALIFSSLAAGADIFCAAPANAKNPLLDKFTDYVDTTSSVFCYLRDVIDFTNTTRWPAATYGAIIDPTTRAVSASYVSASASVNTSYSGSNLLISSSQAQLIKTYINPKRVAGIMTSMSLQGATNIPTDLFYNDAGVKLQPGNYFKGLKQAVPDASKGAWRIGDETELYGRFCRTWGKAQTAMYFQIDSGYNISGSATIKVTYFDSGSATDSWTLLYTGSITGSSSGSVTTKITQTGEWKTKEVYVRYFASASLSGSNAIALKKTAGNIYFGLVEIVKT